MKKTVYAGILFAFALAGLNAYAEEARETLAATERPPEHKESAAVPDPQVVVAEDFSKYKDGVYPKWWKSWPMQRDKVQQIYHVKVEGGKHYLHAFDDKDLSQQIMLPIMWDIEKYPYLNWRWRPKVLPGKPGLEAREDKDDQNDSACGVYVIYGRYTGRATKYVWSSALPVGKIVSRRDGKLRITPVASGTAGVGSWHSYSINVPQSYEKLFGSPMNRAPTGIAVLTDGNATHTPAECDYADFSISMKPLY